MQNIRSIEVIPVVVGALFSTSTKLKKCIEELGIVISNALLQKRALLGTARTLRKVLDCGKDLWKLGWGDLIKKKQAKGKMRKGRKIVPKTEKVRKSVNVQESTGFWKHKRWTRFMGEISVKDLPVQKAKLMK